MYNPLKDGYVGRPEFPATSAPFSQPVPRNPMGATAQDVIDQANRNAARLLGIAHPPTEAEIRSKAAFDAQSFYRITKLKNDLYADLGQGTNGNAASANHPANDCAREHRFAGSDTVNSVDHAAYLRAIDQVERMALAQEQPDLGKAVYAMERPAIGSRVTEQQFNGMLDKLASLVRDRLRAEGRDPADQGNLHAGIQMLFQDTIRDPKSGKELKPFRYDLEDFWGETDPTKLFVSKLLVSGEGQCRSMPLLYLLLAERLGAEAYWAFSPNHSYVKYPVSERQFLNFETTVGMPISDKLIARSGYMRTEAMQSRIYMDTVGVRRSVAHLLAETAMAYQQRFGYNEALMERCLKTSLAIYQDDIHAWLQLRNLRIAGLVWHNKHPTIR